MRTSLQVGYIILLLKLKLSIINASICQLSIQVINLCRIFREDEENLRIWYAKTPIRRKRHRNADAEEEGN